MAGCTNCSVDYGYTSCSVILCGFHAAAEETAAQRDRLREVIREAADYLDLQLEAEAILMNLRTGVNRGTVVKMLRDELPAAEPQKQESS